MRWRRFVKDVTGPLEAVALEQQQGGGATLTTASGVPGAYISMAPPIPQPERHGDTRKTRGEEGNTGRRGRHQETRDTQRHWSSSPDVTKILIEFHNDDETVATRRDLRSVMPPCSSSIQTSPSSPQPPPSPATHVSRFTQAPVLDTGETCAESRGGRATGHEDRERKQRHEDKGHTDREHEGRGRARGHRGHVDRRGDRGTTCGGCSVAGHGGGRGGGGQVQMHHVHLPTTTDAHGHPHDSCIHHDQHHHEDQHHDDDQHHDHCHGHHNLQHPCPPPAQKQLEQGCRDLRKGGYRQSASPPIERRRHRRQAFPRDIELDLHRRTAQLRSRSRYKSTERSGGGTRGRSRRTAMRGVEEAEGGRGRCCDSCVCGLQTQGHDGPRVKCCKDDPHHAQRSPASQSLGAKWRLRAVQGNSVKQQQQEQQQQEEEEQEDEDEDRANPSGSSGDSSPTEPPSSSSSPSSSSPPSSSLSELSLASEPELDSGAETVFAAVVQSPRGPRAARQHGQWTAAMMLGPGSVCASRGPGGELAVQMNLCGRCDKGSLPRKGRRDDGEEGGGSRARERMRGRSRTPGRASSKPSGSLRPPGTGVRHGGVRSTSGSPGKNRRGQTTARANLTTASSNSCTTTARPGPVSAPSAVTPSAFSAAVVIQALVRGFLARCRLATAGVEAHDGRGRFLLNRTFVSAPYVAAAERRAAAVIQKAWLLHRVRRRTLVKKKVTVKRRVKNVRAVEKLRRTEMV